jgi:sulfatase modifying factor 1
MGEQFSRDLGAVSPGPLPPSDTQADMVRVPGGMFRMGSDRHYPEESPVHRAVGDPLLIDP